MWSTTINGNSGWIRIEFAVSYEPTGYHPSIVARRETTSSTLVPSSWSRRGLPSSERCTINLKWEHNKWRSIRSPSKSFLPCCCSCSFSARFYWIGSNFIDLSRLNLLLEVGNEEVSSPLEVIVVLLLILRNYSIKLIDRFKLWRSLLEMLPLDQNAH